MAGKTKRDDGPDFDDLEGQSGRVEQSPNGNGSEAIDPATLTGNSDGNVGNGDDFARDASGNILRNKDGSPRRKRGRKPGGGNSARVGQSAKANNQTLVSAVETLALTIGGIHLALSAATKTPELKLEDSESQALAKSIANVMEQFDMSPDPRFVAVGGLITTCATIYGPRMFLISERRKESKQKKTEINAANVTDIAAYGFQGNN